MRTRAARIVVPLLLIGIALSAYLYLVVRQMNSYCPPETVETFDEFLNQMDLPLKFYEFKVNGVMYYEARGPIASWALPSGPPAYVFDGSGKLFDWTCDIGDDHAYQSKWGQVGRKEIQLTRLQALLRKHGGKRGKEIE